MSAPGREAPRAFASPGGDGEARPGVPPFPEGDDAYVRTLVFDHPLDNYDTQVLVTLYRDGGVEVAQRPGPGATWGPPWSKREEERW